MHTHRYIYQSAHRLYSAHTIHRYQGLVVLGVAQSALATIITLVCKIHIEPLGSKAAVAFAIQNFCYFGLPLQLMLLAFVNTSLALILWIFGTYGLTAGTFASSASSLALYSLVFTWRSLTGWKNRHLPEKVRKKREELYDLIIWDTLIPFKYCKCFKPKPTTSAGTPGSSVIHELI